MTASLGQRSLIRTKFEFPRVHGRDDLRAVRLIIWPLYKEKMDGTKAVPARARTPAPQYETGIPARQIAEIGQTPGTAQRRPSLPKRDEFLGARVAEAQGAALSRTPAIFNSLAIKPLHNFEALKCAKRGRFAYWGSIGSGAQTGFKGKRALARNPNILGHDSV
jgi:hypothetical protein